MSISYKQAGVDISAGEAAVEAIKKHVLKTNRQESLSHLGGFSSAFKLDLKKFSDPILVSGTDGVGTKLILANLVGDSSQIGIDLVAMCVNDILTCGAEPLFFQDYIACGKVFPEKIESIVKGICEGCIQAGCTLNGGEIAEMPDLYPTHDYDLAGFCVGAVNRDAMIDANQVKAGDKLLGLASSGVHSNGFSLVRKVMNLNAENPLNTEQRELIQQLLIPTRIYVKSILQTLQQGFAVHAMCHVTGGGFYENIPRILPKNTGFQIELNWEIPRIFQQIQSQGEVSTREMFRVFNMGIGFILAVDSSVASAVADFLTQQGESVFSIGEVTESGTYQIAGI